MLTPAISIELALQHPN